MIVQNRHDRFLPELSGPVHPLGSRARVLLTSVFGPYAQDDEFGSRLLNPMELYHNQVTRAQGPFSLRIFHRSWGLMLIQANIQAPCALLDFPTLDRFTEEIRGNHYDVVGISSIISNLLKVKEMCRRVRRCLPQATIVVGGHIANIPDLQARIDADYVVKGEGVRWFRGFLGEDTDRPIRHPRVYSGIGTRNVGITLREKPGDVAATLIPSVGCPIGCNFCSTSAMFGGKGKFIDFYRTGDELFDVMRQLEESMKVRSFFVMDENFLLHRKRALRLLELVKEHDKAWALYVFGSANVLRTYTMEQLVTLGISWVWMGLEGENSRYSKLRDIDAFALVRELQSHGIRVLGSTIIGLENHTPENIDQVIDYAVRYRTDFHQFMLYTPIPGTPLHAELSAQRQMKGEDEYHPGDIHGQLVFNHRHPHIKNGEEGELILRAFRRDFEVNGPSVVRIVRTTLAGWNRYKHHPDPRIRRRFAGDVRGLDSSFSALLGAARRHYRHDPPLRAEVSAILGELHREFGWKSRLFSALGGQYVSWKLHLEQRRLARGWTYEPPSFYETNAAGIARPGKDRPAATPCSYVSPGAARVRPAKEPAAEPLEPIAVS
jgi:hypothetical protein